MSDDLRDQRIAELMTSATAFFRAIEGLRVRSANRETLTATEFRSLARLVEFGPTTPKELAASMAMSTATITAVTDSLVARELLVRAPNEADRRSVLLTPTEVGRTMLTSMIVRYRKLYADSLEGIPTENLADTREILDRITASFESDLRPDEGPTGESAGLPVVGGSAE